MVGDAKALSNLAGIPRLAMTGREYPEETFDHGRTGRHSPDRQVAKGQHFKIILLPYGKLSRLKDPPIRIASFEPKHIILFGRNLLKREGIQLAEGDPSR